MNNRKPKENRSGARRHLAFTLVEVMVAMAIFLWLTDKSLEYVLYDLVLGWRK